MKKDIKDTKEIKETKNIDVEKIEHIALEAIKEFNKRITDEVFFIIERNRESMKKYLGAVEKYGVKTTNQIIGKAVKKAYNLKSSGIEKYPKCTLISSHTKFN